MFVEIMLKVDAKTGKKKVLFYLKKKIVVKNKAKDSGSPSYDSKKGLMVDTYPPQPQ